MGQTSSHVEHKHDRFIKQVSCFNPNMNRTCLVSTHDLFINRLVASGLQVVLDFSTPSFEYNSFLSTQLFSNIGLVEYLKN